MRLEDTGQVINFFKSECLAGRYVYSDPFKPYLHPLNTPSGRTLSLRSPHDHKHHKGLIYALRTQDTNFWEEVATTPGETVGVQKHQTFQKLTTEGDEVGFQESLLWRSHDNEDTLFEEQRMVLCSFNAHEKCYEWTWKTVLTAQKPRDFIMSQWSYVAPDESRVNYHGLGLRFRRDFGCTGGNHLTVDGKAIAFEDAMGLKPKDVTFIGSIDGTFPVEKAGVTLSQEQPGGLFVMQSPFAFVGLGPSNLNPFRLEAGEKIDEVYKLQVFDGNQRN